MYARYQAAKAEGRVDPLAGAMNEDRIAKLEQIGFGTNLTCWNLTVLLNLVLVNAHNSSSFAILIAAFSTKSAGGKSWNARFTELDAYRQQHGNCHVPRNYPLNQSLSNWCANMRNHYKTFIKNQESPQEAEYTSLTAERIAALENIGFVWTHRSKRVPTQGDAMEEAVVGNVPEDEFDVSNMMGV